MNKKELLPQSTGSFLIIFSVRLKAIRGELFLINAMEVCASKLNRADIIPSFQARR
jgi:hypothetical protein